MNDQANIVAASPAQTVQTVSHPMLVPETFEQMQRVGRVLAMSPLFPEHLRKGGSEQAIANGVLVVNMAMRLNEDPLTVAQNIYFVSGKPGWSSSYMIGKANQSGRFENPIDWEISGVGDDLVVTAFAVLKATKKRVEFTCSMKMAKDEGWTKNPKYKSMPELMLRYRSGSALIRLYAPEVMIGIPTQTEIELGGDEIPAMRDVTPKPAKKAEEKPKPAPEKEPDPEVEDAKIVEQAEQPEQEPEAKGREKVDHNPTNEQDEQNPVEQDESEDAPVPDRDAFLALAQTIAGDLDTFGASDVLSMYGPQIKQIKEAFLDIYNEHLAERLDG